MPISGRDAVVLAVLVCCVPLQYWLARQPPGPDQRSAEVYRLLEQVQTFTNRWFNRAAWQDWFQRLYKKHMAPDYSHWFLPDENNPEGQCPAVEVWQYLSPQGTFGMSPRPRLIHPKEVRWRVGQVVRHHTLGYKGVIVGWDIKAKAPLEWLIRQHRGNLHWRDQPNYTLLVDTSDRKTPEIAYVPQENISPIINEEVNHPDLHKYFDEFDGAQYIPSPWLRAVYPYD